MNKPGERPSIKSLGKDRKPLLDTLRVYPDTKTVGDIDQKLFVFNNDQLEALQTFLEGNGWIDELPENTIGVLKGRIEARLGVNGAYDEGEAESPIPSAPTVPTPQKAPKPAQTPAPKASSSQPAQVAASTARAATQARTRRAPRSEPKVRVRRSSGRTAEGRRW
jgi:hypothetical protein